MSISLLLEYQDPQKHSRMVPIATEDLFETYWLPASKLLKLKWIPAFQSGFRVEREDIPSILDELEMLKQLMTGHPLPELAEGIVEHLATRIDRLIFELRNLQDELWVEIYIG
jgi:hypothetical protein